MIQIKPLLSDAGQCECGGKLIFSEYIWQGLHISKKQICDNCKDIVIESLPVNQSFLEQYRFYPKKGLVTDMGDSVVSKNWFSEKLMTIDTPVGNEVKFEVTILKKYDDVIILNTLDYVYGHSLLYFMNLQRILEQNNDLGIVVIVQPMLRWMIPTSGIAEIWTVSLGFSDLNNYYPDLSSKINLQMNRFRQVFLSKGHVIPTNENIDIEKFTGIKPYNFSDEPSAPRITFIWREDADRLWVRNFYILKGCKKLGISKLLFPFHYLRVLLIFNLIRKRLGNKFTFSVTGIGKFGLMPSFIDDRRIQIFNENSEKMLCKIYSQSVLVFGVHGSSMLLPSAHSGMSVSLMPSKRWGNYAEDILFTEKDVRLASFQKRIVPLNLSAFEIRDIVCDMVTGRDYFKKKFIHSDDL